MLFAKKGSAISKISNNVIYRSNFSKGRKGYLYMWFFRNDILEKVIKVIIKYFLLKSTSFPGSAVETSSLI